MNANWVGSIHVLALSAAVIMLTSSEGGAVDVIAAMRLEVSWPDCIVGALVAVASTIALFVFSTRESESDDEGRTGDSFLSYVFLASWLLASCLTVAFSTQKARENRIARREESDRRTEMTSPHAVPVTAAGVVVLPCTWSCIMVSMSFLSYTTPQAIRLAFPQFGRQLRGAVGGFSNLCFVGHTLMLATNPAARRRSVAHLVVHIMGAACSFGADSRSIGLTVGLAASYAVSVGGNLFELWLWTRFMKPMLDSRNPTLVAELPITAFRWLFQRGGLSMSMYCYFEALGCGSSDRTTEDIKPWLIANSTVLMHMTFVAVLSLTLLADSRMSLSAVLRGLAPLYLKVSLFVVFVTSLIPLAMFSGREHSDHQQQFSYRTASTSFLLLWVLTVSILTAGHAPQYNSNVQVELQTQATQEATGDEKRIAGRKGHVVSFSSTMGGGGTVSAGI